MDKEYLYSLTRKINNLLHFKFGMNNLYHRMVFIACMLVAQKYRAPIIKGMDYSELYNTVLACLKEKKNWNDNKNLCQNFSTLADVFSEIRPNLEIYNKDIKEQQRINASLDEVIDKILELSSYLNSDNWKGEDIIGILFDEINRNKNKSEIGQIFTPVHIADFMYHVLDVNKDDKVLDACCGSGVFLVKAVANMNQTSKNQKVPQLFGIEFDREIYALACANMLIHQKIPSLLKHMDARTKAAGQWISEQNITKVLMNPPYEKKYGCMKIVENILNHVPAHTICGLILPDKKLENASIAQKDRILKNHRLCKIIKLPNDIFYNVGITTSIFIFETGVPQGKNKIFTCWMKKDGFVAIKNKGRQDVYNKWPNIEEKWMNIVKNQKGDSSCQWIDPEEHLSHQIIQKPFEIYEEDFMKTAMDFIMFQKGINQKEFRRNLAKKIIYSGQVKENEKDITISMKKINKQEKILI